MNRKILISFVQAHNDRPTTAHTRLIFVGDGKVVAIPDRHSHWADHGNQVRGLIFDTKTEEINPAWVTVNFGGQIEKIWDRGGIADLGEVDPRDDRFRHSITTLPLKDLTTRLERCEWGGKGDLFRGLRKLVSRAEKPEWQGFFFIDFSK